ncbi:hypothetical protein [Microbulbifer rhizosphaerae]|uniref:Uncharacterized protein n=1 Tax=Microbulbifer rhizosphaerae TaxID=1562603 RepID=A0A7W4W8A4_9GAMM|nr:hypothetical protein [Microbulbifer rhizosphaerae]MBB3059570.1 hypothetical protein [Microbulbifer rhizosphaerae]
MKIYWTLKSIPEFSALSIQERGARWRKVYTKCFRHWQTWLGLATCGFCVILGGHIGGVVGMGLLGAALGGGIGGLIFSQAFIIVARRYYRNISLCKQPDLDGESHA